MGAPQDEYQGFLPYSLDGTPHSTGGGASRPEFFWGQNAGRIYKWGNSLLTGPNNTGGAGSSGDYIYVPVNAAPGIIRINRTNLVADSPFTMPPAGTPTAGADLCVIGSHLYVVIAGNIYSAPLDASAPLTQIGAHPALGGFGPQPYMTTDGTYLYAVAANPGQTQFGIFKIDPATGVPVQIRANSATGFGALACDGSFIYYLNSFGGTGFGQIGRIRIDGVGDNAAWFAPGANTMVGGCLTVWNGNIYYAAPGANPVLHFTGVPTPTGDNGSNMTLDGTPTGLKMLS